MSTQRRFMRWQVGRTRWLTVAVVGAVCLGASPPANAGARIDLRPMPPMPPGGYAPHTIIDVDVFMVDTGNPDGDIRFIGLYLDFRATLGTLAYPGDDRILGTSDDNRFSWVNPMGFNWVSPSLPQPSWIHSCEPFDCPAYQIILPDDGEVLLGSILVNVGSAGGILDVLNATGPHPGGGAGIFRSLRSSIDYDYWLATTGDLTGGRLHIIVPEPGTLVLVFLGTATTFGFRRTNRRYRESRHSRGTTNRCAVAALAISWLCAAPPAQAGARIDLRPTPPMPPGGYAPHTIIDVDVFMVDTGNPDGDIWFVEMSLNFAATTGTFLFPGADRTPNTPDDNQFHWTNPLGANWVLPFLPKPWWAQEYFGLPWFDALIMLPDDGEVLLGNIEVDVGSTGGVLDVLSPLGPGSSAFVVPWNASFGSWYASRGELSGGRLAVIVPEPNALVFLAIGSTLALVRRSNLRRIHGRGKPSRAGACTCLHHHPFGPGNLRNLFDLSCIAAGSRLPGNSAPPPGPKGCGKSPSTRALTCSTAMRC